MIIQIILYENRYIEASQKNIGKTGENEATTLKIYLNGGLLDNDPDIYLEFERENGSKYSTEPLQIVNDEDRNSYIEYEVNSLLMSIAGKLKLEVVLRKGEYCWKSYALTFNVLDSINATNKLLKPMNDLTSYILKKANMIEVDGEGNKFLSDDGTYKEVSSGSSDYNDLSNIPMKKLYNMDSKNPIVLKSLESGIYILHGYFKPNETSDKMVVAQTPMFACITTTSSKSYIQLFFAYNNQIQYLEISNDSYTLTNILLNDLVNRIVALEGKVT